MSKELFLEHYIAEMQVRLAVEEVKSILDEKTIIYQKTQPKSPVIDTDKVDGGLPVNKSDEYLIQIEEKHINERLATAQEILKERLDVLDKDESMLRKSNNINDKVYLLKYVDGLSPKRIAIKIIYSQTQVYRVLKHIRQVLRGFGRDFVYKSSKK